MGPAGQEFSINLRGMLLELPPSNYERRVGEPVRNLSSVEQIKN
jgi:ABC-type bacteriocin/lantibiotic exporter with double-glycine peptidase domain